MFQKTYQQIIGDGKNTEEHKKNSLTKSMHFHTIIMVIIYYPSKFLKIIQFLELA